MATFTFFDEFGNDIGKAVHNLSTHTLKICLTNSTPDQATWQHYSHITGELGTNYGYTAGGAALANVTWVETAGGSGTWKLDADDYTWTASGGTIGSFRYVVMYNASAANSALIGYLDYTSSIGITTGNTFTVDRGTSGFFQIPIT